MREPKQELLKTDTRGRVRTPRERRESLLDEFERSGASAAQFAKLAGIRYSTFANWVQGRRRQRQTAGLQKQGVPRLVEAVVEGTGFGVRGGVLRVELPGGGRMELCDPSQVILAAALLRELALSTGGGARC